MLLQIQPYSGNSYFCQLTMWLKKFCKKAVNWELWPFALIYAPVAPLWFWYALKANAFWWFTPANPTLTFAGFDGEGKKEMYQQLSKELYPLTIYIQPNSGTSIKATCFWIIPNRGFWCIFNSG